MRSILDQDFSDYEIIITDNTPDNTIHDLINGYKIPNLKYYQNDPPIGGVQNWNAAIDHSQGKFIKLMHSDDWFTTPESLRGYVELLEGTPSASLAFSGSLNVSTNSQRVHSAQPYQIQSLQNNPNYIYNGNFIGAPSATICRRTTLRYDTQLKWLVDVDYYMAHLKQNAQFAYTIKPLVSIGIHEDQATNSCLTDDQLIITEYLTLYDRYSLSTDAQCHRTMHAILKNHHSNVFTRLMLGSKVHENFILLLASVMRGAVRRISTRITGLIRWLISRDALKRR